MPDDPTERDEHIHINCPYCWTEYHDFEQIGRSINFRNRLYRDFVILPMENGSPYLKWSKISGIHHIIKKIRCPGCEREYSIALPWRKPSDRNYVEHDIEESRRPIKKRIQNINLFRFISKWRYFALINLPLIFAIIYPILEGSTYDITYLSSMLLAEIVLILFIKGTSKRLTSIYDIEKMPYLIHKNYLKSSHNNLFKKIYFNEKLHQKNIQFNTILLIVLTIVPVTIYFTIIVGSFIKLQMTYEALFSFAFYIWLLVVILYLFLVLFMAIFSLMEFISPIIFVSKEIPLKIDPWSKKQEFQKITKLWAFSLFFTLFITILLPIILSSQRIIKILTSSEDSGNTIEIIMKIINETNFSYFLLEAGFLTIVIFIILWPFHLNVERRKNELINSIKKEIMIIKNLNNPSNNDIARIPILIKEFENINNIVTITWKNGIFLVLPYIIAYIIAPILKALISA